MAPQRSNDIGHLHLVALTVAEGTDPGDAEGQSLKIPQGWTAEIWANLPGARLATWDSEGRLLVSNGDGGTVTRLTPTEPGKAPEAERFLTNVDDPQVLAFAHDGKDLIVGERIRIVSYDYFEVTASGPQVLVDNLPACCHGS